MTINKKPKKLFSFSHLLKKAIQPNTIVLHKGLLVRMGFAIGFV